MSFNIILNEPRIEDSWGIVYKQGDILETTMHEDKTEVIRYVRDKYGPMGEDIRVKIEVIKEE